MDIEKKGSDNRSRRDKRAGQSSNTAHPVERGAQVAIADDVLVAVTTYALADDYGVFAFALGMQFVADIAATALAAIVIDIVRGAREGPLVRIDLGATNIAYLGLRQPHLPFGAGGVLLLGKVILAETLMAIWTASECFLVAFMAAACRSNRIAMHF